MQYGKLLEIIWLIASREAIAASWNEIQPTHFLIGILKISEFPQSEFLNQQDIDKNSVTEMTGDLKKLQEFFKKENINTTALRRELRSKQGNGKAVFAGGVIHRSEYCKQLFAKTEQRMKSEGKELISLVDLFLTIAAETNPELFRKKEQKKMAVEIDQLIMPYLYNTFDINAFDQILPVVISLSKRILQQTKGILIFYEDLDFCLMELFITSEKLLKQSQINVNQLKPDHQLISESECIELLDFFTANEKDFLVFPAIDNENEIKYPVKTLIHYTEQNTIPSKIIVPVNIKLQKWWYSQCPKSKLFLSPMICNDISSLRKISASEV
jgi:hypothetical protein